MVAWHHADGHDAGRVVPAKGAGRLGLSEVGAIVQQPAAIVVFREWADDAEVNITGPTTGDAVLILSISAVMPLFGSSNSTRPVCASVVLSSASKYPAVLLPLLTAT